VLNVLIYFKEEQRNSADQSSVVNEAYSKLRKPYSRAKYLLHVEGVELKSSHGGELDHNFLMEIMEENEKIEETDDLSVLTEIEERNLGKVKEIEEEMASSFSSKNLDVAGDVLAKMKYYQTILDNVGAKLGKE
jgi:molecular chaperone HscB